MRAHLAAACGGDSKAVADVAMLLTSGQRAGLSALPDPLPLATSIRDCSDDALTALDRRILLVAAVCVDDRVEILLEACDITMDQLIAARASAVLSLLAGRFWYADIRTRVLAHGTADLSERTEVHRILERVYRERGEADHALWHRALSSMEGDAALTSPLLRLAAQQLAAGHAAHAHAIAREAASHADSDRLDAARLLAARSALSAGWIDDALAWLAPMVAGAAADSEAIRVFSIATTLRHGSVSPGIERQVDDLELDLFAGRWAAADSVIENAPRHAAPLWRALRMGLRGDLEEALALLAVANSPHSDCGLLGVDAIPPGPLLRAHRDVLVALLRTWHGDLAEAYATLRRAAAAVPVAVPFGGLAVRLARRLELAIGGRLGDLSAHLGRASTLSGADDRPMERALVAYLSGRSEEGAAHLRAWTDRRRSDVEIGLPGLDEVGSLDVPAAVQPPDADRAAALRRRIRHAGACIPGSELMAIEAEARLIRSPFERGRIDALLGTAHAARGDRIAAVQSLRASIGMLADAGAVAWRSAVETRLARLETRSGVDADPDVSSPARHLGEPLAACRSAWQPLLTARELEIAMCIAEGASNRSIAEALHLSVRTIEVNAGRIFRKFGVRTRGELTALAHRTDQLV